MRNVGSTIDVVCIGVIGYGSMVPASSPDGLYASTAAIASENRVLHEQLQQEINALQQRFRELHAHAAVEGCVHNNSDHANRNMNCTLAVNSMGNMQYNDLKFSSALEHQLSLLRESPVPITYDTGKLDHEGMLTFQDKIQSVLSGTDGDSSVCVCESSDDTAGCLVSRIGWECESLEGATDMRQCYAQTNALLTLLGEEQKSCSYWTVDMSPLTKSVCVEGRQWVLATPHTHTHPLEETHETAVWLSDHQDDCSEEVPITMSQEPGCGCDSTHFTIDMTAHKWAKYKRFMQLRSSVGKVRNAQATRHLDYVTDGNEADAVPGEGGANSDVQARGPSTVTDDF